MRYETLILIFVWAHRENNFALYVEVLENLTPLFFALDNVNYVRCLPVHIRDMKCLPSPIKDEFEKQCQCQIQSFPPALSDLGKLHLSNSKSDLLNCIGQSGLSDPPQTYECTVLDGAVIVHFLPTNLVSNLEEYADQVFIPYLTKQLQNSMRIDLVWDTYLPNSLKESTREKRGKGAKKGIWSN